MQPLSRVYNSIRFGWKKDDHPKFVIPITPSDFNNRTLEPTDTYVKKVIEEGLIGPNGITDDQSPRAVAFYDKGARIFPNRKKFEKFLTHLVGKIAEILKKSHPDWIAPPNFVDAKRLILAPYEGKDFPFKVNCDHADGYQKSENHLLPQKETLKSPHLDYLKWSIITATYGDNINIDPNSGIPFVIDLRHTQRDKIGNHSLPEWFFMRNFPEKTSSLAVHPRFIKDLEPYQVSFKDIIPGLNLSKGHDRLAILMLNRIGEEGRVLHGATKPEPLQADKEEFARRPFTNVNLETKWSLKA